MELVKGFFTDPVLFFSFTGLAVLLGICVFYIVYFIHNAVHEEHEDEKPKPHTD